MRPCDGMVMLMDDEMVSFGVLVASVQLDPFLNGQPGYWLFWKWANAFFELCGNCAQMVSHFNLACFDGSEAR